jgi:hypothetical protein
MFVVMQALRGRGIRHAVSHNPIFLDKTCAGDEVLRVEVEALLAAHQRAGEFYPNPSRRACYEDR